MTVYVDDMHLSEMGRYGRMKMSHMIADKHSELVSMAVAIGVRPKWIQHAGTHREHFDICMSMRQKAIELGAVPITMRELVLKCRDRYKGVTNGNQTDRR